jgi:alpha-L-fucosidase
MADGTIPQEQQDILLKIGAWLDTNGEAIYGTRPWTKFMEPGPPSWHFTTKRDTLYAIAAAWPEGDAVIASLASDKVQGKVDSVTMLGHAGSLDFTQDAQGLRIKLPAEHPGATAWSFKITGLKLRP